jgi:hypothetical protein
MIYRKVENLMSSNFRYLAKIADSSISISITYIVFVTKLQKSKFPKMDLPLLENDITIN